MAGRVWVLAAALAVAGVAVVVGPDRQVVCGDGHVLDRVAQRVARGFGGGHVDGPDASTCAVPSAASWAIAAVVLCGGAAYAFHRRLH